MNIGIMAAAEFWQERSVILIAYITVGEDEPLEKALRRFKRMKEREGIVREWKKREYYEKPSVSRRRQKKAALRKMAKKNRKLAAMQRG